MKISVIFPCFATKASGGHKVVYEYINKLSNKNHEITCYYLPHDTFSQLHLPDFCRKLVLDIYIRKFGPSRWFSLDKRIKNQLYRRHVKDADIVIATAIETVKPVMDLTESKGKKVYFIQDFENWNYTDEEVCDSYNLSMTNVVVSKWLKAVVDQYSKTPAYLVSNCINTEVFYNKNKKRKEHSIVFHYRSGEYKGAKYAIEVIRKLQKRYSDLSVEVIGVENEPENLPECCRFHHKISAEKIAKINNQTKIFMCTTIEEGFGLPGLEAMACGCAVVSFSYKGVFEYAVDRKNALLSPVRDVDKMVDNIVRLFEDNDLMKKISENGIKTGKEKSLKNSAEEFERILLEKI